MRKGNLVSIATYKEIIGVHVISKEKTYKKKETRVNLVSIAAYKEIISVHVSLGGPTLYTLHSHPSLLSLKPP